MRYRHSTCRLFGDYGFIPYVVTGHSFSCKDKIYPDYRKMLCTRPYLGALYAVGYMRLLFLQLCGFFRPGLTISILAQNNFHKCIIYSFSIFAGRTNNNTTESFILLNACVKLSWYPVFCFLVW